MSDNQPFDPTATSVFGLAPVVDEVEEAPVALSARDREAVRRCLQARRCSLFSAGRTRVRVSSLIRK